MNNMFASQLMASILTLKVLNTGSSQMEHAKNMREILAVYTRMSE